MIASLILHPDINSLALSKMEGKEVTETTSVLLNKQYKKSVRVVIISSVLLGVILVYKLFRLFNDPTLDVALRTPVYLLFFPLMFALYIALPLRNILLVRKLIDAVVVNEAGYQVRKLISGDEIILLKPSVDKRVIKCYGKHYEVEEYADVENGIRVLFPLI
ncbi:hypothetical protein HNQ93_002235 [Hymenobacter luteus]|uniref:Uncharacterized protein n=2 Tax=Hymenobacter TaxID=89966 RepID=A0A7W9WCD6_9BACT|nr:MULTISPECIES: hypothetical protein [Hymenobacter]MBB4602196.1 hypothetical protein [Hymenobacter latericoloratus]MBB6059375.1 hypothetical protein [Hymenobacter luteus]